MRTIIAAVAGIMLGASGDPLYEKVVTVEITINELKGLADNYIAVGAWDGPRGDMRACTGWKNTRSSTGASATCKGVTPVKPAKLPHKVVEEVP